MEGVTLRHTVLHGIGLIQGPKSNRRSGQGLVILQNLHNNAGRHDRRAVDRGQDELKGRSGRATLLRLYQLRIESATRVVDDAQSRVKSSSTELNQHLLSQAKAQLADARASYDAYCTENKGACPKD